MRKQLAIRLHVTVDVAACLRALAVMLVEDSPDHSMLYSIGSETLDWYFELGDLIADEIVIREVFQIPDGIDIKKAVDEILDRQHKMATAFTDFAGYFIRASCAR